MESNPTFSPKMHKPSRTLLQPATPVTLFRGNSLSHHFLTAFFLLGFLALCVFSQEPSLVSVPLGSEISGHENRTWVSPNGIFSFGFLDDSQEGDDEGFVVGIWHNLGNTSEKFPVWTVGNGVRVCENSTFQLGLDGSLVLFDGSPHGLPVWSSNTSNIGVRSAALMDNGNLVLVDFGGKFIWESFNSPTDTLLPGQPLHFPQCLQASSANSVASYYSLKVRRSGEMSLVWEDNVTYWSSHLSSTVLVKEARLDGDGLFGIFDDLGGVPWYRLSGDFKEPSVKFRRLRIDVDGNLRIYSWDGISSSWKVGWQAVQSQCDVFGYCGLYSVCSYDSGGPSCDCLNQDSGSGGCERMADLSNCEKGLSMMDSKQTVLYSLYPPHDVDIMLSEEACRDYCLNDTSCFAATSKNDGSGLCTVKRTSFISGYSYSSIGAKSFLKVCLVPEAVSARAANIHGNARLPLTEQPQPQPVAEIVGERKSYLVAVVVLLLITGFVFLTVEMAVFWFVIYKRRRTGRIERKGLCRKDDGMNPHYSALVRLSLEEVKDLTKNFGNKLAPSIYKGILPNKLMVTVKVLNNVVVSERDFQLIASALGSTHHRNLVALKGYCYEPTHKLLLYEYVNNGSLAEWLFSRRQNRSKDGWHWRLNMAIGIARALAYLHLECKQCITHGNLKLENVLLDENLAPKLTDFGLQSLVKADVASSSETLPERDVYMFGRILLQIVSGKRETHENKLCDLAYQVCENGRFGEFVGVPLEGQAELEGVQRVVRFALWCMQDKPTLRPSIGEAVMVLEGALSLDMPPTNEASKIVANRTGLGNSDIIEVML